LPKNFQMTPSTIPNNTHLPKVTVKLGHGLPDVTVLPLAVPGHKRVISGSYSLISGKAHPPRCSA